MWTVSPPNIKNAVPQLTLSTLITKTWGFLWVKPLVRLTKLLRFYAVTITVATNHAVSAFGVTANG